ncbi:MAG: deoxyribonuclease V [Thermodesulfobacteriota bacterium]
MNKNYQKKLERLYSHKTPLVQEAYKLQRELSEKVVSKNSFKEITKIAGADMAIFTKEKKMVCGIVVFSYPELHILEKVWSVVDEKFPYIPGLLAFREGPAIIETYKKIKNKPEVLIIDGHGIAHPRRFGIACHVGVLLDIPTFGIAKKKLFGNYQEPNTEKGSQSKLISKNGGIAIGSVVRTKNNTKPVFVSIGNKIDLLTAVKITLNCDTGYRIPEPTRKADKYVAELKKEVKF